MKSFVHGNIRFVRCQSLLFRASFRWHALAVARVSAGAYPVPTHARKSHQQVRKGYGGGGIDEIVVSANANVVLIGHRFSPSCVYLCFSSFGVFVCLNRTTPASFYRLSSCCARVRVCAFF